MKNFSFLKNIIFYLFLAFIILVGSYIRLSHLLEDMWWIDGARDVYVARTMWETKTFPAIAPMSGAGAGFLNNSPVYYYFLALVWGIVRSVGGMAYFFAFSGILTIIINYFLGKEIFNSKVSGLVLAFFTAFNLILVQYSRFIFQPNLIPLIISAAIYSWIMVSKNKSICWLFVLIFLLFFGLNIHYSIIIIFPAFIFWIFVFLKNFIKNNGLKNSLVFLSLLSFFVLLLFFSWYYLMVSANKSSSVFNFLFSQFSQARKDIWFAPYLYLKYLFPYLSDFFQIIFYLFIFIFIFFYSGSKKEKIKDKNYLFFIFTLLLCSFLFVFLKSPIITNNYYYAPFFPIALIAFSQVVFTIYKKNKLFSFLLFIIIAFGLNKDLSEYDHKFPTNDYPVSIKLSSILYEYHRYTFNFEQPFFINTYTYLIGNDKTIPSYINIFEGILNKKLAKLVPYDYNLLQNNYPNQVNYLICDHYPYDFDKSKIYKDCIDNFSSEKTNFEYKKIDFVGGVFGKTYSGSIYKLTQ